MTIDQFKKLFRNNLLKAKTFVAKDMVNNYRNWSDQEIEEDLMCAKFTPGCMDWEGLFEYSSRYELDEVKYILQDQRGTIHS